MPTRTHTKHTHSDGGNAQPLTGQRGRTVQDFGTVVQIPIGLDEKVRLESTQNLNQVLADTMMLRDFYKKCHWQVSGPSFYQLHLLFDKHFGEQVELTDEIAERIQALGGVTLAVAHDVAEHTRVERPPIHREEVPDMLSRLLDTHELILKEAREYAAAASKAGDDGTNDLLVSDVIRTNEAQAWFIAEHLVDLPLVKAD
ncbi:MAG: DNA starvation/stationary phase protection protein [Acidobacteriaceae bacterium]|nr:DNA starvation/stationary phase protection protein [Acidobacteriaceae bacterium]MBV8569303.1 DNA starvation/stationary phase protection protein [Acidobacteriaceae bacterium]